MIYVCALRDLARGASFRLDLQPPVAVFHTTDGELYAVDDTCTHQDASLSDGWLEGCAIECPLHEAQFDLRTGEPTCRPARRALRTHQVVVEGDGIHVVLSDAQPNLPPRSVHLAARPAAS
jgi:3-phenylpropionate/trans-cinnamate dioxygenase ferredoxin subunit